MLPRAARQRMHGESQAQACSVPSKCKSWEFQHISESGVGCAGRLGIGVPATGCAGGLTGVGLTAAFAVGLAFLGDARRTGAFFAGFFSGRPGLSARGSFGDGGSLALCVGFAFGFLSCRHLQPPN
jgi:hypothetical protein